MFFKQLETEQNFPNKDLKDRNLIILFSSYLKNGL